MKEWLGELTVSGVLLIVCGAILVSIVLDVAYAKWETRDY